MLHPLFVPGKSVFFDDLYFEVIEGNGFGEIVLGKAGFAVKLEIPHRGVEPDGVTQIKFCADFINGMKNFMGAGIGSGILHNHIV